MPQGEDPSNTFAKIDEIFTALENFRVKKNEQDVRLKDISALNIGDHDLNALYCVVLL